MIQIKKKKKQSKKKKIKTNAKKEYEKNNKINLDNEIIIGLTPKKEEKNNKKKKTKINKKVNKKEHKAINKKPKTKKDTKVKTIKNNKKSSTKNKNRSKNLKIFKWVFLIILLILAIFFFMMSSVFNVKEIKVENNNKFSYDEIVKLSKIDKDTNMFKIRNSDINKNLKVNPYIEKVKVKRSINGIITLQVEERTATLMLKLGNSFVYINNQGYILEMSEEPLNCIMLTGFTTPTELIKEGNRLLNGDLKELEKVLKIIENAKSILLDKENISLDKLITQIDIEDTKNYKLILETEDKVVDFGDCSNINIKLSNVQQIIEQEEGKAGIIYFQDLLNDKKAVFREKV